MANFLRARTACTALASTGNVDPLLSQTKVHAPPGRWSHGPVGCARPAVEPPAPLVSMDRFHCEREGEHPMLQTARRVAVPRFPCPATSFSPIRSSGKATPALRDVSRRARSPRPMPRCCCLARPAPARSCSRAPIHAAARGATGRSWSSTAPAMPATLIESELFGRERGAFTGAHASQIGRFELANRGTIFLDEIGELPLELQPKLLRVLQEGQVERLGSPRTVDVDVPGRSPPPTAICSRKCAQGRFRRDLFYRLERVSDHGAVAARAARGHSAARRHLVERLGARAAQARSTRPDEVMAALQPLRLAGQRARAGERAAARDHPVARHAR